MAHSTLSPRVQTHRFLLDHAFYPVAVCTAFCAAMLAGRYAVSGTRHYGFLAWNLFLAWLPYLLALWAVSLRRAAPDARGPWRVVGLMWLLFLPNAPYIVTDFLHLLRQRPFPILYDLTLIFAFAWTGLLLGLVSMKMMQEQVAQSRGRLVGWSFVVVASGLTGVGIYVGRVLRWNSWHVVTRPGRIFDTFADALADPFSRISAIAHVAVFAGLVLLCYVSLIGLRRGRD